MDNREKYKHADSEGRFCFIDQLGNKGQSWNKKNSPGMYESMLVWVEAGNEIEPLYTSEELKEKEAKETKQALESQKQTCKTELERVEYRISNHPPHPEDAEANMKYIDKLRVVMASDKIQEIPPDPFF